MSNRLVKLGLTVAFFALGSVASARAEAGSESVTKARNGSGGGIQTIEHIVSSSRKTEPSTIILAPSPERMAQLPEESRPETSFPSHTRRTRCLTTLTIRSSPR
jgi:hypothetical protein